MKRKIKVVIERILFAYDNNFNNELFNFLCTFSELTLKIAFILSVIRFILGFIKDLL